MYIERLCNFHKISSRHSPVIEKFYDLLGRPSYRELLPKKGDITCMVLMRMIGQHHPKASKDAYKCVGVRRTWSD